MPLRAAAAPTPRQPAALEASAHSTMLPVTTYHAARDARAAATMLASKCSRSARVARVTPGYRLLPHSGRGSRVARGADTMLDSKCETQHIASHGPLVMERMVTGGSSVDVR